ncbi:MAG: acetyl-CoA carboxylase biotin carboxyl carrier protein subunit [Deltaproteobacteria bacterium]|nr:acetyl-CoA carboxylase biotin carboxyl carrier protein subunit [Deltaproteobacteria bacterium]
MKTRYSTTLEGSAQDVSVEALGEERYRVIIGDDVLDLTAHEVGPRQYHVLHDGFVRDVVVTGKAPAYEVHDRAGSFAVELLDEEQLVRQALRGGPGGLNEDGLTVMAPMPGKVVKALVEVGQEVVEGQGVVVIEAMKMENELRAAAEGVVQKILVDPGQSVDAGQVLVVIE